MISIYKLKPRFQQLLHPVLANMHKAGITPNMITIGAIILSTFTGICIWNNILGKYTLLLVPILLLLRMVMNALDGMMASTFKLKSASGEMLNEIGDVLSDIFIYLPLIQIAQNSWIIILFVILSIINEFAGILTKAVNGVRRYDGPMGKSDRAFLVGLYCILFFIIPEIKIYSPYIFGLASLLIALSSYLRLKNSLK